MFIISCNQTNINERELKLKMFSILISPTKSIQILTQKSNGSEGELLLNGIDTVYFNFGYSIDNLSEKDPSIVYYPYDEDSIRNKLDTSLIDVSSVIYTKKANFDIDEYRKQNVLYKNVSGYRTKITFPRDVKKGGLTGMYIDSLQKDDGGRLKFNLYAKDLDSLNNELLLKLFNRIRFSFKESGK